MNKMLAPLAPHLGTGIFLAEHGGPVDEVAIVVGKLGILTQNERVFAEGKITAEWRISHLE